MLFLAALKTTIDDPEISKQINDTTLRFYDMSPAYDVYKENGNWLQYLQQLKASEKLQPVGKQNNSTVFHPFLL